MKPFTLSLAIMNGSIKIILIATMALTLFSSSGCMSMMARGITDSFGGDKSGIYPSRHLAKVAVQSPSWLTPLALIDLPLSLAVDTVMLPLDAVRGRRPKMDQSVLAADKKPLTKEESAKVIEAAIRKAAGSPTGEFTKADLEKVTKLDLRLEKLTDVKGLEKLTQLTVLNLRGNPDLTKAQIAELQKALPKCRILSNPTK
jgi:uncharacterized protein YceK